jgi:hypothetical protein
MKKVKILLFIVLGFSTISYQSMSQGKISARYLKQYRADTQLSYNFFTGPDAADFATSINGFGSGILDMFGSRGSIDLIDLGTDKFYLSLGAGFAVLKYRFANNLVFNKSGDNSVTWMSDPDTSHNYVNTFFGYGKSKLITTSFYFPVDLNIAIGENVTLSAGGYADLNLTARYKMKYLDGEDKVKEIIRSKEFRNFYPSTTKFGINLSLFLKKLGTGLSATYCLTPFFQAGKGPDIHEARISATYIMKDLRSMTKKEQ